MMQAELDFTAPPRPSIEAARAAGEIGAARAADKAERTDPGFGDRARAFVLAYLDKHGQASGEDIVDACKAAGLRPHEDRAFGSVFRTLSGRGLIAPADFCLRRKGHATGGGRIWRKVIR